MLKGADGDRRVADKVDTARALVLLRPHHAVVPRQLLITSGEQETGVGCFEVVESLAPLVQVTVKRALLPARSHDILDYVVLHDTHLIVLKAVYIGPARRTSKTQEENEDEHCWAARGRLLYLGTTYLYLYPYFFTGAKPWDKTRPSKQCGFCNYLLD